MTIDIKLKKARLKHKKKKKERKVRLTTIDVGDSLSCAHATQEIELAEITRLSVSLSLYPFIYLNISAIEHESADNCRGSAIQRNDSGSSRNVSIAVDRSIDPNQPFVCVTNAF